MAEVRLRVPKGAVPALALLLDLPDQQFSKLLGALGGAKPTFQRGQMSQQIAAESGLTTKDAASILSVLIGLYAFKASENQPTEDLAQVLVRSLQDDADERLTSILESDWERSRDRITAILSLDRSVGLVAKGFAMLLDHPQTLADDGARIFSDIRPVFLDDISAGPAAAVVTHTLKLTYDSDGEAKQFYVVIDENDIKAIRTALDRAEEKGRALREVIVKTSMQYLHHYGKE